MNKHNSKPSTRLDATPFQGRQEGRPTGSEVIIMNTDGMEAPKPGDGLIASRKNKVIAKLGDHSQLVSVYLLGYNRLEKPKISLENILKYTTDLDIELTLADNRPTGSTLTHSNFFK